MVPAFHAAYLEAMVSVFGTCAQRTVDKLDSALAKRGPDGIRLDMESEYSNLALDIIGISVFNYDFGSVTKESPIIQVRPATLFQLVRNRAQCVGPFRVLWLLRSYVLRPSCQPVRCKR